MNRPMRRVVAATVAAIVLAVGWFALRTAREHSAARAALPRTEGRIELSGIEEPVEIQRDRRGVPQIGAANERDAFFGWGFATAQDRLAQILWMRQSARGRTAALIGREGVNADRWARTLGFERAAEGQLARLSSRERRLLDAYAAGVNARLERVRSGLVAAPTAIVGPELETGPWEAVDSLALLKLYGWGLSDTIELSLVLRDLALHLGARAARPFFPGSDLQTLRPLRVPGAVTAFRERSEAASALPGLLALRSALGLDGRQVGSSAWVLGPEATERGFPILAADAHLEPTVPSLLHLVHVRGGGYDAAGAALPGVPVLWTGHNRDVVWASTHAPLSALDLYDETIRDEEGGQVHDGRRWRPLAVRTEVIAVRGEADEAWAVRETRHGPLLDALLPSGESLAVQWVGGSDEIDSAFSSFDQVARAADRGALLAALSHHHEPALTVAYADRSGGGVQVAAWLPERALPGGLVPLPGRARWYDWSGRVPFEALPRQNASGRGWAIASDAPLPSPSEATLDWLWQPGARNERINALLASAVAEAPLDLPRMAELQSDMGSERALVARDRVIEIAGTPLSVEAQAVVGVLEAWNGSSGPESTGAAAYHVLISILGEQLIDTLLGDEIGPRYRALPQVPLEPLVVGLMEAVTRGAIDGLEADAFVELIRESLRRTWLELSYRLGASHAKWTWGRLHPLSFRPLGALVPGDLQGLRDLPVGGDGSSVNSGDFAGAGSFEVRVASTFRWVADLGALERVLTTLAPGQSEHPRHPNFGDAVGSWRAGRPSLLVTDPLLIRELSSERLILDPAP